MNILITAGGNTERIDEVRAIKNTGTGRLGALVAERLAAGAGPGGSAPVAADSAAEGAANSAATRAADREDGDPRIFYVCDRHAAVPKAGCVTVIRADDVTALGSAVRDVCGARRVDAVVHSMAVSDYRVKRVTTAAAAAGAGGIDGAPDLREGGKINSDLEDLLVVLERAPKIIALFRGLAPDAVIVGFKLLSGVSEAELIGAGLGLLEKNDCDYVLANDMKYLKDGGHIGHLIERDGSYSTYDGKEAIADAIAKTVLRDLAARRT
jgi:phosphopantothenate-cysteine ligase